VSRALVTGATRGLGFALVQAFAERGDDVVAVCRAATPELVALGAQVVAGVDVSRADSAAVLREALGDEPLDVVVCNAGVNKSYAASIDDLDVELLKSEFEVNTFGVVRTVQAVLPNLREGSKIGLVSTWRPGVGAARRNYGYQMSKVAMNQFGFLLADDLADRGVATVILSPGPMNTALLREVIEAGHANLTPEQAQDPLDVARDLLARLDELTLATSGSWRFRAGDDMGAVARGPVFGH
jgi:NAD(P)-dependent dehydrogenase (short-subunit alcohol dehydrogenase family)